MSADQETRFAESEESETRRRALGLALTTLDKRERYIFEARRLIEPQLSLAELAIKFRVSRERVRQIETRAFKRVQDAVYAASARGKNPELRTPAHTDSAGD